MPPRRPKKPRAQADKRPARQAKGRSIAETVLLMAAGAYIYQVGAWAARLLLTPVPTVYVAPNLDIERLNARLDQMSLQRPPSVAPPSVAAPPIVRTPPAARAPPSPQRAPPPAQRPGRRPRSKPAVGRTPPPSGGVADRFSMLEIDD